MASEQAPPTTDHLQIAKQYIQGNDLPAAMQVLQTLLAEKPAHRDALYYLAVCQRKVGDRSEALTTLDHLIQNHPDYGRAFQERGHNYLSLNDPAKAGAAFLKAVELNDALIASWQALVSYFTSVGDRPAAEHAMQQAKNLSALPREILTVASLVNENKLYLAEQICRQYLRNDKTHPEGMRLLAEIGSRLQILDDAEFLLQSCVQFHPDFIRARMDYVQVLHRRQKFHAALEQAQALVDKNPAEASFQIMLANEQQAVGNFDQALKLYDSALTTQPDLHTVYTAKGHALKTIGRTDEAVAAYRGAYSVKKDFGDAFWSLANLKTYQFTEQELAQMKQQEAQPATAVEDRIHLCFALGKAYEDLAAYDESFEFYERGNRLKQEDSRYDPAKFEEEFATQIDLFDTDFFEQRADYGFADPAPIFIVGLPRAGSTLLEQILASHSAVDGTMELANVIGLAHRLNGRKRLQGTQQYPAVLANIPKDQFAQFGENFIQDTQYHRGDGVFFIDKMPNNFRHIALIQLMLPKAKIIDARREPMACCFSGFKQLFAEGQEFTYGLDVIGRYYRGYVDLMNHWDKVLPGKVLRVQHEDVIEDLEGQVRRILEHCQLPFEQQCVEFHKTERAVRTPSSEQVRQPIFKSAMQQWTHYQDHLQPLEAALGPALQNYR
ncbi:MAG: tetratricopeptide repeat protein [Gammaproteobacteria bacterium]|nr:tetratricopeptide repeat protein [Gammaproteobacteria bacterium]